VLNAISVALFGLTQLASPEKIGAMKILTNCQTVLRATCSLGIIALMATVQGQTTTAQPQTSTTAPAVATSPVAAPTGQPNEAEMMKQMMELAKPGANHKLLADTAGNWTYTVKMWMNPDPNAKPQESKGMATRKMTLDGHYLTGDYVGKIMMPGADGKMKSFTFHGMGLEGYDNVKQKFVASWVDNMGTAIEYYEGAYDPSTKSFTYTYDMEPVPGMKQHVREVMKVTDKDHMMLEWYETAGGQERKTMEIDYSRAGKK
jgi:hypothetical protein